MQTETATEFGETHHFKPLLRRAQWIKWSFITSFGVQAALVAMGLLISLFGSADLERVPAFIYALFQIILGALLIAGLIAPLVAVGAVVAWTYRAMANLHALKAPGLTMTPLWAVGSYFVPPFLFWKPYTAMREIWRGSHALAELEPTPPQYLLTWWLLWVLSFLPVRVLRQGPNGTWQSVFPPSDLLGSLIGLIQLVAGIIAAILLWRAVSTITRVQAALPERA